jgi:hypothetical protein
MTFIEEDLSLNVPAKLAIELTHSAYFMQVHIKTTKHYKNGDRLYLASDYFSDCLIGAIGHLYYYFRSGHCINKLPRYLVKPNQTLPIYGSCQFEHMRVDFCKFPVWAKC